MNFHLQNNRQGKSTRKKKFFVSFVVLAVVLFGVNFFTKGLLSSVARTPAAALWSTSGVLGDSITTLKHSFVQKEALRNERDILKERVNELEIYALNNLVLASENEELRKLLGNKKEALNQGILARVLSRGGSLPYGTILISREEPATYTVGALAIGEHNTVLGTIAEVGTNNAMVRLLSAPGERTQVLIGADERITSASIRGRGNGNMIAEVARDADIRVDDPVVLFGKETLLVGFVGDIETQATDAFQIVRVRTPLNLETVRFLRII